MNKEKKYSFEINSTNLSGEFLKASGKINIYRLQTPDRIIRKRLWIKPDKFTLERKEYYAVLQKVQHSSGDISEWLNWFLLCLKNAMHATEKTTQKIMQKAEFWKLHEKTAINERQRFILNKLFDGLEGKLQTSKWAKMTKTSTDTALRDIKDLIDKGILEQTKEGGRNANYCLVNTQE